MHKIRPGPHTLMSAQSTLQARFYQLSIALISRGQVSPRNRVENLQSAHPAQVLCQWGFLHHLSPTRVVVPARIIWIQPRRGDTSSH